MIKIFNLFWAAQRTWPTRAVRFSPGGTSRVPQRLAGSFLRSLLPACSTFTCAPGRCRYHPCRNRIRSFKKHFNNPCGLVFVDRQSMSPSYIQCWSGFVQANTPDLFWWNLFSD